MNFFFYLLFCLGVIEQCCFLGLMGVRNTWFLGVETRNKCLYVVNDQPAALQSHISHEGTRRGFPEEGLFIMVMELCVCVCVFNSSCFSDLLEFWSLMLVTFSSPPPLTEHRNHLCFLF